MITWEEENGDYTAKVGDYRLRIFYGKVSKRYGYTLRKCNNVLVALNKPTLSEAKKAAEKAYHKHLKKDTK